jgi:hypothetical protein
MRVFLFFLFVLISTTSFCQQNLSDIEDSIAASYHFQKLNYSSTRNLQWANDRGTRTFENQGEMHSIYLALNKDYSFEFIAFTEPIRFITLGIWRKQNDSTYVLNWDRSITRHLIDNPHLQKKYRIVTRPFPLKISNWVFVKRQQQLIPIQEETEQSNSL